MNLLIERENRVLHITLNRPEKRNALTAEMCSGLVKAITSAQNSQDIGSILIDGAGQVFCAGMDLDEASAPQGARKIAIHEKLFTIGASSLKPIVMHVNGAAFGGGLGLVAQAHVVVAAQGSLFGLTEIRIGMWPFVVFRAVEAAIGLRRTQELSLTGRVFSSHDAAQWGLVHQVSLPFESADRASATARDLARSSPQAVAAGMQYIRASRGKTASRAGDLANALRTKVMQSPDFQEGYAAFKEKRPPKWPSMPPHFYEEAEKKSTEPPQ